MNYLINIPSPQLTKHHFSRIHGVDRSETALKYVQVETTMASIDSLPFAENEFDLVTSLECIEHLPVEIYKKGLTELCRISKQYIIISVPNEEILKRNFIECPCCATNFNQSYHMRSFDENLIKFLLEPFGFKCIHLEKIGVTQEYYFHHFLSRFYFLKQKENRNKFSIPCPVCKEYITPLKNTKSPSQNGEGKDNYLFQNIGSKLNNVIIDNFRKLWPKKNAKRWILALYSKVKVMRK